VTIAHTGSVRISAKSDYAIKAMLELALAGPTEPLAAHTIAERQRIPLRFLLNILGDLRRVGLVDSRRGPTGGWWLSHSPREISVADVIRAVDGPLVDSGTRPGAYRAPASSALVDQLWASVGARVRELLESTTLAELAASGDEPIPSRTSEPQPSAGSRRTGSARGSAGSAARASGRSE
jgi:Rrf2 family protein